MFKAIFKFEILAWLKSPMLFFFVICFFSFVLLSLLGTAGFFDPPVANGQKLTQLNSPFELSSISLLFSKFLLFLVAILGSNALMRDYKSNSHNILYSFPMTRFDYLNGKLFSSLFILVTSCILIFSAILVGELILGTDHPKISDFNLLSHLVSIGIYQIPTLLSIAVFVFIFTGLTRKTFTGFVVVIAFALIQLILENSLFRHPTALALLDPFGQNAFMHATMQWDFAKQNSAAIPINSLVIMNRILWLSLAAICYIIYYRSFHFQYDTAWQISRRPKAKLASLSTNSKIEKTAINIGFTKSQRIKTTLSLMLFDYFKLVKSWMFLLLTGAGFLTVFFIQWRMTHTGEFVMFPYTRILLSSPLSLYMLIVMLSTFLFSALSANAAKLSSMDPLIDASPILNWQLLVSKVGATFLIQITQLILFMILGLLIQAYSGHQRFEMGLYIFHLSVFCLPALLIWNITSFFTHSLAPNIYISLFLLVGLWLGVQSLEQLGIRTHLLRFNEMPQLSYSDLGGYQQISGYFLVATYWLTFSLILFVGSLLIWNRGSLNSFKERALKFKSRISSLNMLAGVLFLAVFSFLGFKIHSAEATDSNAFYKQLSQKDVMENYKEGWQKYNQIPLLKIKEVDLNMVLYPAQNSMLVEGQYRLQNDSSFSIDTILVRTGFDELSELDWKNQARLIKEDSLMKSYLYVLNKSVLPGESIEMNFKVRDMENDLFSKNSNIITDGSFIGSDFLPRLGYQFGESQTALNDSINLKNNFYYRDADQAIIRTTISTDKNQIAIAPGKLISHESKAGRNIYRYETPDPIKFNFSFHSGDFRRMASDHGGTSIEVFFHEGHEANAQEMIDGIIAALDYNTKRFTDYPHDEIRIVEFPHTEESYAATLTSNNIPSSEMLFNVNTKETSGQINMPFYVMSHELTHEWFGNQVMPANLEGATMLTESITEYLSLCIYREKFGDEAALKFLEKQHNRYHNGRKKDKATELSLHKCKAKHDHVAYGKGAIQMNALAQQIGHDVMDEILNTYITEFTNNTDRYPTTLDFIRIVKSKSSNQLHGWIDELFKSTIQFENSIKSVETIAYNKLQVGLKVKKKNDDTENVSIYPHERFEIGMYNSDDKLVGKRTVKLENGINTIVLDLDSEVSYLRLDPNLLIIEADRSDDIMYL